MTTENVVIIDTKTVTEEMNEEMLQTGNLTSHCLANEISLGKKRVFY